MDAALGELRDERHPELQAHLALCATCQTELDRVKQVLNAIDRGVADTVNVEPSPRLMSQLRRRLSEAVAPPRMLFVFWLPAAAGGLIAASLLAILLLHQTAQSPGSNSRQPSSESARMNPASPKAAATTPALHAPTNIAPGVRRSRALESRRHSSNTLQSTVPQTIEVIVPPDEWQAVIRLAAAASSGQINPGELDENIETTDDLPMVASVETSLPKIDQIDVEELPGVMQAR